MGLELGRLFHLWGRRAVVSVGLCMVVDLQLIRENQPRRSHDRDRHQSLNHLYPQLSVLFLDSRWCRRDERSLPRSVVLVDRSALQIEQGITHYHPMMVVRVVPIWYSSAGGTIRMAHHYRRDWRTIPRQDRTMVAGCCAMYVWCNKEEEE